MNFLYEQIIVVVKYTEHLSSCYQLFKILSVCIPGHYDNGNFCELCTGNKVKATVGNATNCDEACDGDTEVSNAGHTACGKDKDMRARKPC